MSHRPSGPVRRFLPYLRSVRGLLAAGLAASLVQAVLQWLAPWPLKVIFDSVLSNHRVPALFSWLPATPTERLVALSAFSVAVAAALAATDFLSNRWVAHAGQRVVATIRSDLFNHLQRQSQQFHLSRQTGDLMSRLDGDTQDIQSLTVDVLPTVLNNTVTLLGFSVIMLAVNWFLGVVSLLTAPVLYWLVRRYMTRIKQAQRAALRASGSSAGVAQEVLSALPVVQAFGTEEREGDRFDAANDEALRAGLRAVVDQSAFTPLVAFTVATTTAVVVYIGSRAVLAGSLTPGDVLVFSAYLRGMYTPVRQLAKLAGVAGRGHAAAERVAEILDTDESVPVDPHPRRIAKARGTVTLEAVGYSYPGHDAALEGIDLEFAAGGRHALVGRTGSGKSTILRLIPRFADPQRGAVRLDGTDVRRLDLGDLRRQIALVPQEPYLFRATLWENIAYGLAAPTRSAAVQAAKAAGVHEIIDSLPEGYDGLVAERGGSLSGGQRQCVALARAVARQAPILLLDEPTTGLDVEIASVLLSALDRVCEGRTTVMISHELRAVRGADTIAVIDRGRLVEVGTHGELSRSGRTYAHLDSLSRLPAGRHLEVIRP
ncbi:MAG: ABC transporter ATP-binding protein [Acidobacteriota bacterium]|nr:ABC transporter ATP-binding protein [Acidobacteriota bacterium]